MSEEALYLTRSPKVDYRLDLLDYIRKHGVECPMCALVPDDVKRWVKNVIRTSFDKAGFKTNKWDDEDY